MDPLPPIPTPPAQRWREFRISILPFLVFLALVLAILFLWRNYVQPAGIVGEVETVQASVTVVQPGTVVELTIEPFQMVTKDQPIGFVRFQESDLAQAAIASMAADQSVLRMRTALDSQRNIQNYEQFLMSLRDQKILLETERRQLDYATRELNRIERLAGEADRIVSEGELDVARRDRSSLEAAVSARSELVNDIEKRLDQIRPSDLNANSASDPIAAAIEAHTKELQLMNEPVVLRAPIDGMVTAVYRRPGEKVLAGQPIAIIASPRTERIRGYIKAPLSFTPTLDMVVQVRPRSFKRIVGEGKILQIGTGFEPISMGHFMGGPSNLIEQALPILVSIPANLKLLPGEVVDLVVPGSTFK